MFWKTHAHFAWLQPAQYDLEIPDRFEKSITRRELYILHDIKQVYPYRNNYAELFFAMLCCSGDEQSKSKDSVK